MTDPTKPTLEQLTAAVDKLHALLHAPQPGLMTWNLMVNEAYHEVNEIVGAMDPPSLYPDTVYSLMDAARWFSENATGSLRCVDSGRQREQICDNYQQAYAFFLYSQGEGMPL